MVSQIAYALDKWNEQSPTPHVVVDVISGASAGAMTGAMLACHLMEGGDPDDFVRRNDDTWCAPHLALSLGYLVCARGHRAYFANALDLARRLSTALAENRLHREMRKLVHPKVLILDEVGYLSLDSTQASL